MHTALLEYELLYCSIILGTFFNQAELVFIYMLLYRLTFSLIFGCRMAHASIHIFVLATKSAVHTECVRKL